MEWVNLSQMTIISSTVGKNLLEEMEWPSLSTKESKMQYLDAITKMTEWSLFISKANHSYHSNPSLYPNHQGWRSWGWVVLRRPTRPSRNDTQKRCSFHNRDWNAKVRSQEIPGVTGKFGLGVQNEAGQKLTEFCQENALVITNTLFQHTRDGSTHGNHRLPIPKSDWLYSLQWKMKKLYTVSKNKTRRWLWLRLWAT